MTNALWLDSLEVLSRRTVGEVTVFKAAIKDVVDTCPHCGVVGKLYRHGVNRRKFVDRPIVGKVAIEIEVQRFRCRECQKTLSQPCPDLCQFRQMTTRCVDYIVQESISGTFSKVARDVGADERTVRNICAERFPAMVSAVPRPPHMAILGIDELMLGGQMRAIFMDVGRRSILDLTESHHKWQIAKWISSMPEDQRHFVRIVTIDMAKSYRDVAAELLPNAVVVVDKFHVVRCANQALDQVRNRARRTATGGKTKGTWRGQRLLRRNASNLSPAQEMEVDGMRANNPLLDAAYIAKEAFLAIWDCRSREAAERAFDDWRSGLSEDVREFEKVAKMVQRWRPEVFAYFDYAATNAITENRNGLIKILNRAGRGYDFPTIRAKALLTQHRETAPCPICKEQVPAAAIRDMESCLNGEVVRIGDICGSCHYVFNNMLRPVIESLEDYNEHHLH